LLHTKIHSKGTYIAKMWRVKQVICKITSKSCHVHSKSIVRRFCTTKTRLVVQSPALQQLRKVIDTQPYPEIKSTIQHQFTQLHDISDSHIIQIMEDKALQGKLSMH